MELRIQPYLLNTRRKAQTGSHCKFPPNFGDRFSYTYSFNPNVPRSLDLSLSNSTEHPSVVCCTKFSLDGKYLATGCNRLTQIFNVENGALIASLSEKVDQNVDLYIRSVCFSPDGTKLAAGAEDNKVRVWDIASKRIVTTLEGHSQDIYSLDFSRDGKFIVSGSGDKSVKIWSVETGECMNSLMEDKPEAKDSGVTSVCVSHDSKYVASVYFSRIIARKPAHLLLGIIGPIYPDMGSFYW